MSVLALVLSFLIVFAGVCVAFMFGFFAARNFIIRRLKREMDAWAESMCVDGSIPGVISGVMSAEVADLVWHIRARDCAAALNGWMRATGYTPNADDPADSISFTTPPEVAIRRMLAEAASLPNSPLVALAWRLGRHERLDFLTTRL